MKKLFRIKEMGRGAIIGARGILLVRTSGGAMIPLPEYAFGIVATRKIRERLHELGIITIMIECPEIRIKELIRFLEDYCRATHAEAGYVQHMQDNLQDLCFDKEMKQDA
jgi:hypothetical protein